MARNNPVTICATKQIPRSVPKFHQPLIVDGVGNSTRASFAILNKGVYFVCVYSLSCVLQWSLRYIDNIHNYN